VSSLKSTIDKIKSLENEKNNLLIEIEGLKKMVDAKAAALENEVGFLRDELKSLKVIVGPEASAPNKIQI
jgi:regulator of replication initiation timing